MSNKLNEAMIARFESFRANTPESSAAQGAMGDEVARPDLIEKLTYHAHECDDLALDEALDFLAQGWKKVHGRTERQMVFQIVRLLASQPSEAPAQPIDLTDERAEFIKWITYTYPKTYTLEDAEHYWRLEHVSSLAWKARALLANTAQCKPEQEVDK